MRHYKFHLGSWDDEIYGEKLCIAGSVINSEACQIRNTNKVGEEMSWAGFCLCS